MLAPICGFVAFFSANVDTVHDGLMDEAPKAVPEVVGSPLRNRHEL
jgi:hypothetical protein